MTVDKVDLHTTRRFGTLFLDYLAGKDQLDSFYGSTPNMDSFKAQIDEKKFPAERRKILCQALEEQYQGLPLTDHVKDNLQKLSKPTTFTITTGHQLNLFTGPLYFIYKIITVIKACQDLKAQYPDYDFVPVYWMATEDHDFEEINHFRFSGKKYQWQTGQHGAVGRFDLSSFGDFIKTIPGVPGFFKAAYQEKTLAGAVRHYVNHLFGDYGLLVIDGDHPGLKRELTGVIKDDILNHTAKSLVDDQSARLEGLGYKTQVFPREINFFYLDQEVRERIERDQDGYNVLNTAQKFDKNGLEALIEDQPGKFSPNVILRPLYQEMILPNLAYVGGPAEVAYWLQLKPVFDHYGEIFPLLLPRNFALIIPAHLGKKWEKTGLSLEALFEEKHSLMARVAVENADHKVKLNGQVQELVDLFDRIRNQASTIDPTLIPHVEAQQARTKHKLEGIEKKFVRAEKRQQEDRLRQVESVIDDLFPNGNLQERTDNFLDFYLVNPTFIDDLVKHFEPFDYRFHVAWE